MVWHTSAAAGHWRLFHLPVHCVQLCKGVTPDCTLSQSEQGAESRREIEQASSSGAVEGAKLAQEVAKLIHGGKSSQQTAAKVVGQVVQAARQGSISLELLSQAALACGQQGASCYLAQ